MRASENTPAKILGWIAGCFAWLGLLAPPVASAPASDPYSDEQWGLRMIKAPEAWEYTTGKGIKVAVIDSGVDLGHPDLVGRIAKKAGLNLTEPGSPPQDDIGHGTHVAGIIAAANNGIGIVGVAPKARIIPIKVCTEGSCDLADVTRGIEYAIEQKAHVINLSLAYGEVSALSPERQELRDAIAAARAAGIVVVAAAGNTSPLFLPICHEPGRLAVCVGAVGPDRLRARYSNGDATMTETYLVAPGGDGNSVFGSLGSCDGEIISTYPRGLEAFHCQLDDGYAALAGTSMAAPHVSGVAALLAAQGLAGGDIIERMLTTAQDVGPSGRDPIYGYGLVDAEAAVRGGEGTGRIAKSRYMAPNGAAVSSVRLPSDGDRAEDPGGWN